ERRPGAPASIHSCGCPLEKLREVAGAAVCHAVADSAQQRTASCTVPRTSILFRVRGGSSTMSKRVFSFRSIFASWWKSFFEVRNPRRHRTRRHWTRLLLELLEDRTVPTTYTPAFFHDGPFGSGSLRDAVLQANADPGVATDIIKLKPGPNGQAYELSIANINDLHENFGVTGDLNITSKSHDLIIEGEGFLGGLFGGFDPTKTIIDARGIDRAFQIDHTLTKVTFKNLTIQGGLALDDGADGRPPGTSDALGGAILAEECHIVL